MVKMLVRHGANLEYVDHALRNALYWSVYNCCGEITTFLLDCGAKVKPWSWIADEALPASFTEDSQIYSRITKARQEPHSLLIQTRYSDFFLEIIKNLVLGNFGKQFSLPLVQNFPIFYLHWK